MEDGKFLFWQKLLTAANVMTLGVGFMVALFPNCFLFEFYNQQTYEVFHHGQVFPAEIQSMKNWLMGIIGATIIGFHTLMIFISENAFKKKERWAYWAMCLAMLLWFCIDSSISFYYGAIHNIVMINLVALIAIGIPLIMTRKTFSKGE